MIFRVSGVNTFYTTIYAHKAYYDATITFAGPNFNYTIFDVHETNDANAIDDSNGSGDHAEDIDHKWNWKFVYNLKYLFHGRMGSISKILETLIK